MIVYSADEINPLISIICPTHKRPFQLQKMITSAVKTAKNPSYLEFCFYINQDDDSYKHLFEKLSDLKIKIVLGPKTWLSQMYNSLLTVASGDVYLYGGDDIIFRTPYWDNKICSAFEIHKDKLAVVHVNDGANYSQKWATIGAVHREWIKLFGYVFTPHIPDNGIDAWITHVSNFAKRTIYLNDVLIEHLQYRQGKSEIDDTYAQRLIEHKKYNPLLLYKSLLEEVRRDCLILFYKLNSSPPRISKKFLFSDLFVRVLLIFGLISTNNSKIIYFSSMKNITFIKYLLSKIGLPTIPKKWK